MMTIEAQSGLAAPGRAIPVPTTVSPQAQAVLSRGSPFGKNEEPDPSDTAAWERRAEQANGYMADMLSGRFDADAFTVATHQLRDAPIYEVASASMTTANADCAVLYVHGGGFTVGGGIAAAYAAMSIAGLLPLKIFSIDYRMPPHAPFPAGLDDTVEAYRWLLDRYDPARLAVYGPSAGGGLAASFLLKARDLGLPIPAACVLHSPEADLTESGDTFETNADNDGVLSRLTNSIALYAHGHDLRDPYLSPLFGDFAKGFPPTLLTSGTRDLFLSNTVLMHRALLRAGIPAELHVWEAMGHGGFFGEAPEDHEMLSEQAGFIRRHLGIG